MTTQLARIQRTAPAVNHSPTGRRTSWVSSIRAVTSLSIRAPSATRTRHRFLRSRTEISEVSVGPDAWCRGQPHLPIPTYPLETARPRRTGSRDPFVTQTPRNEATERREFRPRVFRKPFAEATFAPSEVVFGHDTELVDPSRASQSARGRLLWSFFWWRAGRLGKRSSPLVTFQLRQMVYGGGDRSAEGGGKMTAAIRAFFVLVGSRRSPSWCCSSSPALSDENERTASNRTP